MARTATKDETDKTKPGVHPSIIKSLINKAAALMADMAGPRSDLGDLYKNDVEKTHHLNRQAFKTASKVDGMEDTQRNDWLRTFDQMREALGWNNQKDLFEKPAAPVAAAEKTDEEKIAANVHNLRGIKQLDTESAVGNA